jgi:hypothetical protein
MESISTVEINDFAEATTVLGLCRVGYTAGGELALTFDATGEVYLLPIAAVLGTIIDDLFPAPPAIARPAPRRMM